MSEHRQFAIFCLCLAIGAIALAIRAHRSGLLTSENDNGLPLAAATPEHTPVAFWLGIGFLVVVAVGLLALGAYAWNHDVFVAFDRTLARLATVMRGGTDGPISSLRLVVSGLLVLAGVTPLALTLWSYRWPAVEGRMDSVSFGFEDSEDSDSFTVSTERRGVLELQYAYVVAGREYQGTWLRPLGFSTSDQDRRAAWQLKEGKEVRVLYCPAFPRLACLQPGGMSYALGVAAVCGGLIVAVLNTG